MFKDAIKALDYTKVLLAVGNFCHSEASQRVAHALSPMPSHDDIRTRSALAEELRYMMQRGDSLGLSAYNDIEDIISSLAPRDALLDPAQLLQLKPALIAMTDSASGIMRMQELLPLTLTFTDGLMGFPDLLKKIEKTIGADGDILDSASYELAELRGRVRSLDQRVSRRLEEITRTAEFEPFLQDDFVTKRSGRWVLPVRMDSKGMVSGVVHDVSRTGETAFMEPLEIIGLSNELETLHAEVRAEEIRVLRALSAEIQTEANEIKFQFKILVRLDIINAIAAFSERHKLTRPEINTEGSLTLLKALNPLLLLMDRSTVIPLDMTLGLNKDTSRVMAITGPNAGGKTVTMKTVGLTILMALSGLPIPAQEGSGIPFITELLVDIGDEQSLETQLSTFSAHVTRISEIINNSDSKSLVIFDELGTGTDPEQGGALSCSILRKLKKRGSSVKR